jgi:hypothetical protein
MSTPQNSDAIADLPGMQPRRHALGLPAGSVRAILALMVVALICILILMSPREKEGKPEPIPIPAYLFYLLFLIIGHFFAAHGVSIHQKGSKEPNPLYLPSGVVRFLLIGMLAATIAWKYSQSPDELANQLGASMKEVADVPFLPVILLGGFLLGVVVHALVGWHKTPYWFQDFEAWVALVAVLLLAIEAMIHCVINPSLKTPLRPTEYQTIVAAVVAFYFGARS